MRVLALDLGERRIGVALSDSSGTLASPYTVIERSGSPDADRQAVAKLVEESRAEQVVVGLPVSLSGSEGPAAASAREEARLLAALVGVPVDLTDERLTTVEAARRRRDRGRSGRQGIDAEAAAILLENWLASRRSTS
jgi:putative Holliday junction resolvase